MIFRLFLFRRPLRTHSDICRAAFAVARTHIFRSEEKDSKKKPSGEARHTQKTRTPWKEKRRRAHRCLLFTPLCVSRAGRARWSRTRCLRDSSRPASTLAVAACRWAALAEKTAVTGCTAGVQASSALRESSLVSSAEFSRRQDWSAASSRSCLTTVSGSETPSPSRQTVEDAAPAATLRASSAAARAGSAAERRCGCACVSCSVFQ